MILVNFIGRSTEIGSLDSLWRRDKAEFLIVYGRRRVGKTRLLTHWLGQQLSDQAFYWVAQPSSPVEQLRSFSQALYRFDFPDGTLSPTFTYDSWEQALEQVARISEKRRLAIVIDEFTYLLSRTPELAGLFQNVWDHLLKQSNLFLILCGSHLGMMRKHVLSYQAPLYGRASAQFHIQPLPFGLTKPYFPTYTAAERVAIYSMFGGVPAYWERLDQSKSISDNIREQLLTPNNLMQAEPRLLLHDFIREPDNYMALLRAIANGYRTQKEMMSFTGLKQGHVSSYLSILENSGFIKRHIPITAGPKSRKSRYHVADPYLRFYFRFLANRQDQLALNVKELALKEIQRHLLDFIGTHTWEELCREWVFRAGATGVLPFMADQVGSYWDKSSQIDVVGINRMEKTLVLGECKWSPKQVGTHVADSLLEKTDNVVPRQGQWRVYYLVFARGGWVDSAEKQLSETTSSLSGKNWQAVGGKYLDLETVDRNLVEWI